MSSIEALTVQNAFLVRHLIRRNLNRDKVHVNGYLVNRIDSSQAACGDDRFNDAVKTLERANDSFMARHKDDVMKLVLDLDTSDGQLHSEFLKSAGQVVDEIRWGRISSLFFLTSLLAERLINEKQGDKVESLGKWLVQFLNDNVSHWIAHRGGWGAITDALKTEAISKPTHVQQPVPKAAEVKGSSWLTFAALGVGALVVGSLAMR